MNVPSKPRASLRINLAAAAGKAAEGTKLSTPFGAVRRREGLSLPPDVKASVPQTRSETLPPKFVASQLAIKREMRDVEVAQERARLGKLTSLTDVLDAIARPESYRTYSAGIISLAKAIRELSRISGGSVAQRFGCATPEDLAVVLLTVFRKKSLADKAVDLAEQRGGKTLSFPRPMGLAEKLREIGVLRLQQKLRKPQGRIWAVGGGFWEEIVKLDEVLTRILREAALSEARRFSGSRSAFALRPGPRGKLVRTDVVIARDAEISAVFRSTEVATQRRGSDKLLDSIDDIHVQIVKDGPKRYLLLLVRAQLKREQAAAKLAKQTDRDLERWTSDDLEAVVLKDHLDEAGIPLRFKRDEILFVGSAVSSPFGIVQSASAGARSTSSNRVAPGSNIKFDELVTPKGVAVRRVTVGVDVELHDVLIELVLESVDFK